jgi:hypothetical protein
VIKQQEEDTSTPSRVTIETSRSEPAIIEAKTYLPPSFHCGTIFNGSCKVLLIFMESMRGTQNEWKSLLDEKG